jgi:hypothetical protein
LVPLLRRQGIRSRHLAKSISLDIDIQVANSAVFGEFPCRAGKTAEPAVRRCGDKWSWARILDHQLNCVAGAPGIPPQMASDVDRGTPPSRRGDDLRINDFLREYLGMTGTKFGCGAVPELGDHHG